MVFIKTLAWSVIESDEEIIVGMTEGLMSQPTHLKGLHQGHALHCFLSLSVICFLRSFSSQLFTVVGVGTNSWLLGITSPSLPSCLPSFLPLSPPLSPFLPP